MGQRHLGIGFESAVNTPVVPTVFDYISRFTPRIPKNFEAIEVINEYSPVEMVPLASPIGFDFEMKLNFQTIAYWLYLFYGVAPTTTGSGPYTHTFPPTAGLASDGRIGVASTAEIRLDDALSLRFAGCKLTTLAFSMDPQGALNASASVQAQSVAKAEPATPSYLSLDLAKPGSADVTFDGTSVIPRSLGVNLAWAVDEDNFGLTSLDPAEEYADSGLLISTGNVQTRTSDFTQFDKLIAGSDVDIAAVLSSPGAAPEALTMNFDRSKLIDATPPVEGKQRLVTDIQWQSYRNNAATENIQCVVVNDVASVPA